MLGFSALGQLAFAQFLEPATNITPIPPVPPTEPDEVWVQDVLIKRDDKARYRYSI